MSKTTDAGTGHIPVLLAPVLDGLNVRPEGRYIDGTFGRGGHSREILQRLNAKGRLLAIDRDPDAIAAVDETLQSDPRFEIVRGEIAQLKTIGRQHGLLGKVDGLLLDLGVSSPQLDDPGRGFSFRYDGPLDMRMDPQQGEAASSWLAAVSEKQLKKVLYEYGEEKNAPRIARAIVAARATQAITRTAQLAEIVAAAAPGRGLKIHPATKTFQAIRIYVNAELQQLGSALQA
ncbi:MAG: 16S rRNA (cytosine(1402)-N(4))-methyltransferase RsmH, partial [Gammaproteobacteria bacterium]|nr:16S rRNA (cytosine(1402)-N(4))-methyltransferase RsmH [Gammaproteobacteria bacterium]